MKIEAIVTNHAKKRIKERCGLNKKSIQRMATRALNEGHSHSETKGRLNKWVTSLYFNGSRANNIRLYGGKAYIFKDNVLITVIPIPNNLLDLANNL